MRMRCIYLRNSESVTAPVLLPCREVGLEQPSGAGAEEMSEAALLRGASSDPVGSAERQADLEGLRK